MKKDIELVKDKIQENQEKDTTKSNDDTLEDIIDIKLQDTSDKNEDKDIESK